MKQIHLPSNRIKIIQAGEATAIWLADDPQNLSVNDVVELVDGKEQSVVGELLIRKVVTQHLADFDDQNNVLTHLVGAKPSASDAPIKEVHFSYQKHDQTRHLADIVVNKSTDLTEVKLYGDGGSRGNPGPAASGWVLYDLDGTVVLEGGYYMGITTNNQAEYTALKLGLKDARKLGAKRVQVFMDSLLVVNQMKGLWKINKPELRAINVAIHEIAKDFEKVTYTHVPRALNSAADRMVNVTLDDVAQN